MFDAKYVREHASEIKETIERQQRLDRQAALERFLEVDSSWRSSKLELDNLRAERNKVSLEINAAKKAGKDASGALSRAKEIPGRIKELEASMAQLEAELKALLAKIPNIMHEGVPFGKSDADNPEVQRWGEPRKFSFPVKNHVELCESLGIADFEASAKTTGNGFYFLKGDLGLLNQALIRFATELMVKKGFGYVEPPLMVRKHVLDAAMDTAAIEQSVYKVVEPVESDDPLCLIGTAEHAILGMLEGRTLTEDELPLKLFGYSMCFRQEIGSHGINEKGLWRTHQFNKVEQFIFCTPEQSWAAYDELYTNSEAVLQALKLPYRVVEICTGDLAAWKARSHDFEVWRPTTQSYGEVMSLSNCTTYQATDLGIRYVRKNGERGIIHTLNDTALATSRIMVAVLENYQNEDGSITVPEVLRQYMGGKKIIQAN